MAQIRESRFAIMEVSDEDADLIDLAGEGGVIVETEHEFYSDELEKQIDELDAGDVIRGKIQGEDVLQPNAIWRFLEFDVIGHDPGWIRDG
ncbi:hypothetical protein [Halorubrum sp. 48-1-W]|uniref:hypothetical protein n=1 Tax=Halorubrum sp. 48-1-W TaxID=2249761 RepID=UPI000FC9A65C|nr:hypothetical protein [Halorubrum sp. 48-1-W]